MEEYNGWIKLYRKAEDWQWYTDIPVKVLYFHLLIKANYQKAVWREETLERGDLITSLSRLAQETGLSEMQVRNALKKLQRTGEIKVKSTNRFTRIRCLNYVKYQEAQQEIEQTENASPTSQYLSTNRSVTTNKKNKKEKKKKNAINCSFDISEIQRFVELNENFDI